MFFRNIFKDMTEENITKNRRLLLANERTFLAWIRTSIGIMAFGFVLQKFGGSFLTNNGCDKSYVMFSMGLFVVLLGVFVAILATYRFIRTQRDILEDIFRPSFIPDLMISFLLGAIGLLMIIYLILSL